MARNAGATFVGSNANSQNWRLVAWRMVRSFRWEDWASLDDQEPVRASSEARVEAVTLQLAAVQSPEGRGQVGAELTLQEHVIAHAHGSTPLHNI